MGVSRQSGVVTTGSDGRATWTYPGQFSVPGVPRIQATVVDPTTDDATGCFATIESVGATQAVIRVWAAKNGTVAAGAGISVHLFGTVA